MSLSSLLRGLFDLVYPAICPACHSALSGDVAGPFCPACAADLTAGPAACPRCAADVGPHTHLAGGCPSCRGKPLPFEAAVRLGAYGGRLRELVLKAKWAAGRDVAEYLGMFWARHAATALRGLAAEVVVPVPLHWRRHLLRGYTQAGVLARELADGLGLAFRPGWLRRVRPTPFLSSLPPSGRADALKGAFRSSRQAAGRCILLVDDVFTTGATMEACGRALRDAGAARVVAAALARA